MRLVDGVEVSVGETVDHVAEGEQKEEDENPFPEGEGLERRRVFDQKEDRDGEYRNLRDAKFDAAYAEHVKKKALDTHLTHVNFSARVHKTLTRRMSRGADSANERRPC